MKQLSPDRQLTLIIAVAIRAHNSVKSNYFQWSDQYRIAMNLLKANISKDHTQTQVTLFLDANNRTWMQIMESLKQCRISFIIQSFFVI